MKPIRHLAPWTAAAALAALLGSAAAAGSAPGAPAPAAPAGAATPAATAPGAAAPGAAAPGPGVIAPAVPAAPPAEKGLYLGPTACGSSSCHGSTVPRKTLGVRQDEYFIWQKRDFHARADAVLYNDRSRIIARRLHLGDPGQSQVCLTCHALSVPARLQRGQLEIEDGISCESCHGPASGWLEGHRSESWTHQQSVAAGMTDLRNVELRANLCLSCHVGAAGKSVNHDLIAAGHPQLAFELDNYTEGMPAHWLPFAERRRDESERDTHGARAWAVGQAAGFRAGLEQIARHARGSSDQPPWPEFSDLSCDACHHSLAQERWRTAPDRPGRPGVPRFSPARYAVLRHLVAVAAPERQAALEEGIEQLSAQLGRLGAPPAEVAAAAERLSRETAELIPRLDRLRWDDAVVRQLLLAVAEDRDGLEIADYASAQQAALAVQTLISQLLASDRRRVHSGLAGVAEGLAAELQNPYAFDAGRFAERLAQVGRQLQ